MPSSAARAEQCGVASGERIVEAVRFLAGESACGLVWLDGDLRVRERYGMMTAHLEPGTAITSALDALLGLDADILALESAPGRTLVVPNVLVTGARSRDERATFVIYWMADLRQFLLVITRAASFADIEYRLAAEVRARAIAEAEVAAQTRMVSRINQELQTANRDLQEFASVISHDLRAPLRGARYAASDCRAALLSGEIDVAAAHAEQTLSQVRRMGAMLTGLLDYARAGRKTEAVSPVDTAALAEEVAASIRAGTMHEIVVEGRWPTIVTLAEPLDILLRNLIDNAVKHHDRDAGRIVVRADPHADHLAISVSDDGPGIEPAWHEAIFLPFKTIADEQVDGAGIGLALVKKTVERFGGSIEVESDPAVARGTTFRLAWPLALPE